MTEPRTIEALETLFSGRIRSYANAAARRPFDATAAARTAMASSTAVRRDGARRWWLLLVPAAALVAIGAIVVGGIANQPRLPAPSVAPGAAAVPDALRHRWVRPYAVAPGEDVYGSGFLNVEANRARYGREEGPAASTSAMAATGASSVEVTATDATKDCDSGAAGAYGWSLSGSDTVLTLTPITADGCAARQKALAGQWVRDFPPGPAFGNALPPGTHTTSTFDPLENAASPTRLTFTVPGGWALMDDRVGSFTLQRLPTDPADDPLAEPLIAAFANPRVEADFASGATCGPTGDAPGVGSGVDELVAAIVARPGVVAAPPRNVTIAGHQGRLLDLQLDPSWAAGCLDSSGPIVGMPILHMGGSLAGPVVGLTTDQPVRIILLDIGGSQTLAIVIAAPTEQKASDFEPKVAAAMPIIESFGFEPATSPTP